MSDLKGALYFYDDEPHIFGFLTIGDQQWELVGVKRSGVAQHFTGKRREKPDVQADLFDDRSGDSGP
jgi:hypothetical protein